MPKKFWMIFARVGEDVVTCQYENYNTAVKEAESLARRSGDAPVYLLEAKLVFSLQPQVVQREEMEP